MKVRILKPLLAGALSLVLAFSSVSISYADEPVNESVQSGILDDTDEYPKAEKEEDKSIENANSKASDPVKQSALEEYDEEPSEKDAESADAIKEGTEESTEKNSNEDLEKDSEKTEEDTVDEEVDTKDLEEDSVDATQDSSDAEHEDENESNKQETHLEISFSEKNLGSNQIYINVRLLTGSGENERELNGDEYDPKALKITRGSSKVSSGYVTLSNTGTYTYTATFEGNEEYKFSEISKDITVIKYPSLIGYVTIVSNEDKFDFILNADYPQYDAVKQIAYYGADGKDIFNDSTVIDNIPNGEYRFYIPSYLDDDTYYKSSDKTLFSNDSKTDDSFIVSAKADERVVWTKQRLDVRANSGQIYTTYVKTADKEKYAVKGVNVYPEEGATVSFIPSTGEVSISNVTSNITLEAVVEEKAVPTSIEITKVDVNRNGNYSEQNPYVQFYFEVVAKDKDGNIVPDTTVYFKSDEKDVSFTQSRKVGTDGLPAVFAYSYGLLSIESSADYKPVFALDSSFSTVVAYENIHLILQKKSDLVLYTSQIVGTLPEEKHGQVLNVPDNYELWSGEVHQGALVVGSGEWIKPENGKFTGLSAGQKLLRFAENFDPNINTFTFASNYAYFEIPRGVWSVSVDEKSFVGVTFIGETKQVAEPGGTVFIYFEPVEGKNLEAVVDKPSYISGQIYFNNETGVIIVSGITGNIVIKAAPEETEGTDETGNNEDNDNKEGAQDAASGGSNSSKDSGSNIGTGSGTSDSSETSAGTSDNTASTESGNNSAEEMSALLPITQVTAQRSADNAQVLGAVRNTPNVSKKAESKTGSVTASDSEAVAATQTQVEEPGVVTTDSKEEVKASDKTNDATEEVIEETQIPLTDTYEEAAFPWWILILVIVILAAATGYGYYRIRRKEN